MSEPDPDSLRARLFVALQYLLPQHLLSQLVHWLTRSRVRWVKNALIDNFVVNFRPDMSEAVQSEPLQFASFNEFFTRALRPEVRPPDPDPNTLVSPVDGSISQIGALDGSWLVQAKGLAYTLESLLAAEASRSANREKSGLAPSTYLPSPGGWDKVTSEQVSSAGYRTRYPLNR